MTKRLASLILAIAMFLQIIAPQAIFAKEEVKAPEDGLVTVGVINGNSYDAKLMLELNRLTAKNRRKRSADPGTSLFGYFDEGQEPKNEDKLKYHGEVKADLKVTGLDGNPFQWKEIFGEEEVHLRFMQMNDETGAETGVERVLNISQGGTYTWTDGDGDPAELPLFNNKLEPLTYEVKLDEEVSDKVKLLTARLTTTGNAGSPTFEKPDADGRIKYHLTLEIGLQQVASSKFVSEWHTAVEENKRPQLEGTMTGSIDVNGSPKNKTINLTLPTNDNDEVIVRTASRRDKNKFLPEFLFKTPTVKLNETNANGLTFDTTNKTVKSGEHKFKYDFKYDVINGGKLVMTEIIPVTFDANGGKFANFTAPDTETKIVKEVEYDGTLTDKAENPKKDLETFKGWGIKDNQGPITPATDADFKNITEKKTFYAIWDNNEIQAKELEVKESFKNGTKYVNDFIPKLDDLMKQVKIKKSDGTLGQLADDDKFAILKDDGQTAFTQTEIDNGTLKNYLYEKLQEKANSKDEPTRIETVKAKVTFANNKTKTVDIPIKVVKNIYEAKTLTEKPYYVPKDYVKVIVDPTIKAEDPQKTYYYVNKDAKVVIPGTNPEGNANNTFEKWLIKGTTTEYKLKDKPRHQFTANETTIEAQYVSNIIPQTGKDRPGNVPDNFVLVEFKQGEHGTIASTETTKYWVKPNAGIKLSDITHPSVTANDGWKQNGWDKDKSTAISGATEVTAQYLEKVLKKKPTANEDKYVKVEFKQGDHGTIANTEQTQYWVLKQEKVNLTEPKVEPNTGYAQKTGDKAWSPKVAKYYYEDTEHVAQYDFNGENVIPQKGTTKPTTVPEGYVLVEFSAGNNGKFESNQKTKYWVNPNKEVTLPAPTIIPNTGYRQQLRLNAWDKYLTATFKTETKITAQYKALGDILTEEKPGYVKVVFMAGDKGQLDGTQTYWVNPLKGKTLGDVTHPNVSPSTGWSHNGWDKADNTAITASPNPLVVKAQYLEKVLKTAPTVDANKYVTVTFTKGAHGEIKAGETEKYWVLKNTEVTLKAPDVTAATGYAQKSGDDAWLPKKATKYSANTEHVAQYVYTGDDVVPANQDGSKPDGTPDYFVLVTFDKGDHGDITSGQTKYYVNPNKEVTLTAPSVTANQGYEQKPGFNAWDKYLTATFKDTTTIKAQYNKLDDILTEEKPGYVKVEFKTDTNGTLDGTTIYWVNPAANKKLSDIRHPKVTANTDYKHVGWDVEENTVITEAKEVTAKYLKDVLTSDPHDTTNYVRVTFDQGAHGEITAGQAVYWVLKNTEVTLTPPTVTADAAKGFKQKEGKAAWSPEIAKAYSQDTTHVAQYEYQGKNVIPQDGTEKPASVPNDFVKVTFKPTDKAATNAHKIFWVKPNVEVTIPIAKPEGKNEPVSQTNPKAYKWEFTKWVSEEAKSRTWEKNIDNDVTAIFTAKETVINAEYKKVITDQGTVVPNEITVHESFKNGDTWVNNFIGTEATEAILKAAVKVTNASGQPETLPSTATVTFLNDVGAAITGNDLKSALYDKIQEKDNNTEPIRTEKLKAKVKFANNEEQTVDIPIKVVKNIYEAKTKEGKPNYVPDGYVKVTVDPTTKAKDPQKYFYYVNPNAKVLITKENPVGVGANTFVKWANGNTEYKLAQTDNERYQFAGDTIIKAEYTTDVIEQTDPNNKPNTVPSNFVKVTFKPTNEATDTTDKIYWVNPTKEVTFPIADPVGAGTKTFKEWKLGNDVYKPSTPKEFTDTNGTTITATYVDDVLPAKADESAPDNAPADYVKVTVVPTDKATDETKATKIFWVNPKKVVTLKVAKPVGKDVGVGQYENNKQEFTWKFNEWKSSENGPRTWKANVVAEGIKDKFPVETTITAQYEKDIKDQGNVSTEGLTVAESFKDGETWINNFIPSEDILKKAIKIKDASGTEKPVPQGATVAFVLGKDANGNNYADLATELYDKLQEKDETEVSRIEKIKAKVTFKNGEVQDVEIPIKVVKNIYEAKTKEGKPIYVPDGYIKVTLDPTTKAKDPQKTYFYVNPAAKVVIPGSDPEAISGYRFINWTIPEKDANGNVTDVRYILADRHQFKEETTIKANYTGAKDIIPFNPNEPTARPEGYYLVRFEAEAGLKLAESKAYFIKRGAKNTSGKDLTLAALTKPDVDAAAGYAFDSWDKADVTVINNGDIVVTAKVKQGEKPVEPGRPDDRPDRPYPEIIYRDKIVEKEKIVEKIVKVGENDELLKEIRYMQGYNGKFRPYDGLTRAEAAQILANALKADGYRYDANYALSYSDVGSKWYTDAVRVVTQANVFQGYSDGTFRPQGKITRAEWVATLRRFQDLKKASGNTMMLRSGHWATEEVEAAYQAGWLGVYQDGTAKFDADKPITRQEVAYVSNRAFRRVLDKVYLKRSVNTLLTYKDINPSMPLYEDILCASNTLLTDGRYYKANTIVMDNVTFNIVTDYLRIQQKKFQYNVIR